jgi:hypothetical protein
MAEQLAHDVKLLIAGEEEGFLLKGCAAIARNDCEVLDDIGKTLAGEEVFPEVGGFVPVRVGRVAFAVVMAFVEG